MPTTSLRGLRGLPRTKGPPTALHDPTSSHGFFHLQDPFWRVAGLGTLVQSPCPVSWVMRRPPTNPCGLRSIQSQPCPIPCLPWHGQQPPTSRPGLWDRERAEGLALHTNVLPIVKAPLCQRAPLRRLRGGHNGGSVPKFPRTVTCFQSLPPHHPPHAPVSGGPREPGGVGPGLGGGKGRKSPPPPPGWGNGHLEGRGPAGRARAACGWSWNAGSVQPAERRKGNTACPLLGLAATSPPPPTAGLIYAEAHRHTLIYAAPHMARGRGGGGATCPDTAAAPGPQTCTPATIHSQMPLHPQPTPPFPLHPLHQPQPAQHHSTPAPLMPSLASAAPTQVITSLHLL